MKKQKWDKLSKEEKQELIRIANGLGIPPNFIQRIYKNNQIDTADEILQKIDKQYVSMSDAEVEQVAYDEAEGIDWNSLGDKRSWTEGFIDGAKWHRDK